MKKEIITKIDPEQRKDLELLPNYLPVFAYPRMTDAHHLELGKIESKEVVLKFFVDNSLYGILVDQSWTTDKDFFNWVFQRPFCEVTIGDFTLSMQKLYEIWKKQS